MPEGGDKDVFVHHSDTLLESLSRMPTKVNSLWLNPQLLIALHSPYPLLETGLRMCPAEKGRDSDPVLG
jgi:hypothetical protein